MRSNFYFNEPKPNDDRAHMNRSPRDPRDDRLPPIHHDYRRHDYGKKAATSNPNMGYSPGYSHYHHTRPSRQLHSVVTSSFSLESRSLESREEDDMARGYMGAHRRVARERYDTNDMRNDLPERDGTDGVRDDHYYHSFEHGGSVARDSPSARSSAEGRPPYIQKSFSTGMSKYGLEPMKRNYFHHSRPSNVQTEQLPSDFIPPKRAKVDHGPRGKELVVSPRTPQEKWYDRAPTWESDHEQYTHLPPRTQSFPPPPRTVWGHRQSLVTTSHDHSREPSHVSTPAGSEPNLNKWYSGRSPHSASPRWSNISTSRSPSDRASSYHYWDSPNEEKKEYDEGSYDRNRDSVVFQQRPVYFQHHSPSSGDRMQMVVEAAAATDSHAGHLNELRSSGVHGEPLLVLALPQDRVALSETLCVVRENIEVFVATKSDVDAPAPGRKHAVVVGQVGLRCIHCRHTTKCSDRVKRAVCYPSSIKRIYRTVIDMKLDHFSQCRFVPHGLKERLHQLKAVQTRSTGTTMQYFIRAAHALGMEDGPHGVRLAREPKPEMLDPTVSFGPPSAPSEPQLSSPVEAVFVHLPESPFSATPAAASKRNDSIRSDSMVSAESFDSNGTPDTVVSLDKYYEGRVPLGLPEDKTSLSPLRCFLREQVCAFSATEEDIVVRAPTTFSIIVGQVGIGCIHCVKEPAKSRSNRAVCFPFSIGRIYQSVADIQRFHFPECRMLPPDVKEKFIELQSASSKGSKGLATRQYWITSAKKIGLVDTQRGIRFGRDPLKPEASKAFSLDILAQAAFSVTTASKRLVIPEDKESIAEFLYVVMEQLQPCRFTEADRNKRRLKDVGCIGVECKHCAGQVDSRKFFWSSVNAVESNFVSVHTHMLECRMVPDSLKNHLAELKSLRKEQTAALRTGSQKAFFARVWQRLHDEEVKQLNASLRETSFAGADTISGSESCNGEQQMMDLDTKQHSTASEDVPPDLSDKDDVAETSMVSV